MQLEMSRSDFKKRISALVNELHGSGFKAFFTRFEVLRRPFIKTAGKLSPAGLYSELLWLKPNGLSELDFLIAMLRHMGATAEDFRYVAEMHRIEEQRYQEARVALMAVFSSVRLTKPVEAVSRSFSKRVLYFIDG
jgi:hypothetical protein